MQLLSCILFEWYRLGCKFVAALLTHTEARLKYTRYRQNKKVSRISLTGGNTYLCSALVAMKQMKALRSTAKLECEYVLLYSKDDESGKNIREDWQKEGK
jgi:hypothetical protein